jgi:dipeptidyl aminopeptidase/acylaminoacyl peptidase
VIHWSSFGAGKGALYTEILSQLMATQPFPVSVSPDGELVVLKDDNGQFYTISEMSLKDHHIAARSRSLNFQLSITWRPDSQGILYQEANGRDRSFCILNTNSLVGVAAPLPKNQTALPAIRFSSDGSRVAVYKGDAEKGQIVVGGILPGSPVTEVSKVVAGSCDFSWSPDNKRIAVVSEFEPDLVKIINIADGTELNFNPSPNGDLKNVAWCPNDERILVTARDAGDEYCCIYQINGRTGSRLMRLSAEGGISRPLWFPDGKSFLYHVSFRGLTRLFVADAEGLHVRSVGPTNGIIRATAIDAKNGTIYAHFEDCCEPPSILSISSATNGWVQVYAAKHSESNVTPAPEVIEVPSFDGVPIPMLWWRSRDGSKSVRKAAVFVHGGTHLQTLPSWDALTSSLVNHGVNVFAVNYRGSGGYGRRFEVLQGDPAGDVVFACQYIEKTLDFSSGNICLVGASAGGELAAEASARDPNIGGLVLLSWNSLQSPPRIPFRQRFVLRAFHGEYDPFLSPRQAKNLIMASLPLKSDASDGFTFYIVKGEGHSFWSLSSAALISAEILGVLNK